jgi:hypothetical protein
MLSYGYQNVHSTEAGSPNPDPRREPASIWPRIESIAGHVFHLTTHPADELISMQNTDLTLFKPCAGLPPWPLGT